MKKFDIITILVVLIISISFYLIYFDVFRVSDNRIVEVTYKNQVIYTTDISPTTNITLEISSKNNVLTVYDGRHTFNFPIPSDHEILNIVSITFDEIHMHDANCPNKYCLHMKLTLRRPLPIVCTNGVMVKLKTQEIIIEV